MKDWGFAQTHVSQQLAELHMFSVTKVEPSGDVEFIVTVKEYISPKEPTMHFFAQTNQKTAPYRPNGWGKTMLEALSECIKAIDRFPYEGEDSKVAGA